MADTRKLSDVLTPDEMRELQQKSDLRAAITLFWNWALIALAFGMAIIWTNPLTIILGILILGGRQLGLGIINHDCSHSAFFKTRAINEFVGHWLAGAPNNISLAAYRAYHLKHHQFAGTPKDPDIGFVKDYPVTRDSLKRKFTRDLTGRTGFRDTLAKLKSFKLYKNHPWLIFHILLLATLTAIGAPWAYLMWWAAEIFLLPAILRLRQIGEHGGVADRTSLEPRLNTGTTLAPWWQRLIVGPNHVHYHLEHHLMPSVPPYNLKKAHHLLVTRGFYGGYDCITEGYQNVLRRAVRDDDREAPVAA